MTQEAEPPNLPGRSPEGAEGQRCPKLEDLDSRQADSNSIDQGDADSPNVARLTSQILRTSRFMEDYGSLPENEKADLFRILSQVTGRVRQHDRPLWSASQPAAKIRCYRQNGRVHPEEVLHSNLSPATRRLMEEYATNIAKHGDDALGHLCLTKRAFNLLLENGVEVISQSRDVIDPKHPLAPVVWSYGHRYPSIGLEVQRKLENLDRDRGHA